MSTLIIGGLFVVGIAALIALFFVVRTEAPAPRVETARIIPTPAENREAAPQRQTEPEQQATSVPDVDATERLPYVPQVSSQLTREREDQTLKVTLNGQFHELADGLRSLQRQTIEMEQRLSSLNQMIDTIEQEQNEGER